MLVKSSDCAYILHCVEGIKVRKMADVPYLIGIAGINHSELLELAKDSVSNCHGTFLSFSGCKVALKQLLLASIPYITSDRILQHDTSTPTTTIVPMHSQVKAWPSSLDTFVTKQRCDPGMTPLTAGQFLTHYIPNRTENKIASAIHLAATPQFIFIDQGSSAYITDKRL